MANESGLHAQARRENERRMVDLQIEVLELEREKLKRWIAANDALAKAQKAILAFPMNLPAGGR